MFILRRISSDGKTEMNFNLGKSYVLISDPERVEREIKELDLMPETYAVIFSNDGKDYYPCFRGQHNYIMCSDGRTFAKINEL